MKVQDLITEYRAGPVEIIRKELPGWPEYVIKDMLYSKIGSQKDLHDKIEHVRHLGTLISSWKFYPKMLLTFDMLTPDTQKHMSEDREFGAKNPCGVPDDTERNANAEALVKSKSIDNLPPIIMEKNSDGLELWEGWHRTMAAFRLYPNGFKVNAWIGSK